MHLLEEEPEEKGRWRRLGLGALITAVGMVVTGYGAQRFEPTRRLIEKVVQMTVLAEPPKKDNLPPPRTVPPPPPPKRPPPKADQKKAVQQEAPKPENAQPQEQVVGLDEGSFGEGGEGAGFQVGNTQLGEPEKVARTIGGEVAEKVGPQVKPKVIPAKVLAKGKVPGYTAHARKMGIEGLVVVEVDVDEGGRVTRAKLRQKLEQSLDEACLEAVKTWLFEPAKLAGRVMASTRFLRLRFELDR